MRIDCTEFLLSILCYSAQKFMAEQYQHLVQRAYLERWKVAKYLYVIDKTNGGVIPRQSAKGIMGKEGMQTAEMESAFEKTERCIGNTAQPGEIIDRGQIHLFAEWMALHLVRNALNSDKLAHSDYAHEVRQLSLYLGKHYGYWMDFSRDILITGDNPVVQILDTKGQGFYFAAMSPRRCVFLVDRDRIPKDFMPPTINWYIYKAASRYCVSFDRYLHIEDLPSAKQPPGEGC